MKYRIVVLRSAEADLERLSKSVRRRMDVRILSLGQDPYRGAVKLKGRERFRVRVGDYRIVYEIRSRIHVVAIERAAHRKDAYR